MLSCVDEKDLIFYIKKNRLIFANLKKNSLKLLHILLDVGVEITRVTSFNLVIYAIHTPFSVIKCYENFGFELEDQNYKLLLNNLIELDEFLVKEVNAGLFDYKINSIGSAAMLFLKKYKNYEVFLTLPENQEKLIKTAYYGGRCELFQPGVHKKLLFYDFPSMYGNIMLDEFPTTIKDEITIKPNFLDRPGFYDVTIYQNAEMPSLPCKLNSNLYFVNGVFRSVY